MNNIRQRGILKVYDVVKGCGFIRREIGKDVFVHFSEFVDKDGDAGAIIGSIVEFDLRLPENPKGPRAKKVTIVG